MRASDNYISIINRCRNAMCNHILYLGMHFLMIQIFLFCCIYYCFCHRMWKMFFQTRCNTEQFIRCSSIKGNHIHHGRCCFCKCTSLVKYDRICLCHGFQILSALYGNIVKVCFTDCRQHRNRHWKLKSTRKIYHQDWKGLCDISRQQIGKSCSTKWIRYKPVCKMFCLAFYSWF